MALPTSATAATLAFTRFGLGARFDLSDSLRSQIGVDPRAYLESQLAPQAAVLNASGLQDTKANLQDFMRQQQDKKIAREAAGQQAMSQQTMSQQADGATAQKPQMPKVQREAFLDEAQARFQKAFDDPSGFIERLVWFWSNHFSVSLAKGGPVTATAGSFEREAIRPFVLGKFADMLRSVEQHPTMLFYLDNRDSIGPNSRAGQRQHKGLNENLAREILELHTLGVNGGYTQADVTNFARIITGWTYPGLNNKNAEPGVFIFNPNAHEPGAFKVLGKSYGQQGAAQGEAVLTLLAAHPATAKHMATKFARHFVSDNPPLGLIATLENTFTQSGGDLKALTLALIKSDEAWDTPSQKLRTPQEFLLASSRALNLPPEKPQPLIRALNELGQPLWKPSGPNGFGDREQDWASPEGMKVRLAYASLMARQSTIAGNPSDAVKLQLADAASPETSQAVARAESKAQGLALLLMSPEFQRR